LTAPSFKSVSITLLVGAVGGWLFTLLSVPLAWLIGAMMITTALALSGVPVKASHNLRAAMIPVLGIMLGSSFTPETLSLFKIWLPSLSVLLIFICIIMAVVGMMFYRVFKMGVVTAYFSSAPGGLVTMAILGKHYGGDDRTISLIHSIRILLTVLIIPVSFRLFADYQPQPSPGFSGFKEIGLDDGLILIVSAIVGYGAARILRIPSANLVGPMLASAVVHGVGWTTSAPPIVLINIAQVVIGIGVGVRFSGVAIDRVMATLKAGALSTVLMISLAVVVSALLAKATGLPFQAIVLAFAPGGLAEMALVSLAMGIDTAFVSTHHLVRVLFMIFFAPVAFATLKPYFPGRG